MTVIMFDNLNVGAFDERGHQVPELQKSFPQLFAENAIKNGYNPEGWVVESPLGNCWRLFKTDIGWNWEQI